MPIYQVNLSLEQFDKFYLHLAQFLYIIYPEFLNVTVSPSCDGANLADFAQHFYLQAGRFIILFI